MSTKVSDAWIKAKQAANRTRPTADDLNDEVEQEETEARGGPVGWGSSGLIGWNQPNRPGNDSQYIPVNSGPGYMPTADQAQRLTDQGIAPAPTWVPANVAQSTLFYGGGYFTGSAGRAYAAELEAWAKTIHSNSTGNSLWEDAVIQSEFLATDMGRYITPYEIIQAWANNGGGVKDLFSSGGGGSYGGGGYGGGGYSATSSTMVLSNREDARLMIDSLALRMIGRTVNDSEFEDYYQTLLEAERSNPTVVTQTGDTVTQQSGLGAAGREQILTDAFRENEDYADFQVGGRMVDMFQQYLNERGVFDG